MGCAVSDKSSVCSAFFFFKQKTAYELRISDWSSDVCSSDLAKSMGVVRAARLGRLRRSRAPELAELGVQPGPVDDASGTKGRGHLVFSRWQLPTPERSAERCVGNEGGSPGGSRGPPYQ